MEPIATRHLTWTDDDGTREVRVRIWAPVRAASRTRSRTRRRDRFGAGIADGACRHSLPPRAVQRAPIVSRGARRASDKRRELERLVEATIAECVAVQMELRTRAAAQACLRLDPDFVDGDLTGYTARELIDALREASAQRLAHKRDSDREARRYFMEKMFACFRELAKRPEYPDALRALASAGDRDLRLHAAERLSENDTTLLARLRDEGIEPEADKAARHKPWDEAPEIA